MAKCQREEARGGETWPEIGAKEEEIGET